MIRQIITIGRDMGVGLVVDTQSANLDSLGLANDASIDSRSISLARDLSITKRERKRENCKRFG
jgi:hypothetical protein